MSIKRILQRRAKVALVLALFVGLLGLMVSAQDQKTQVNYSYGLPLILYYTGQLTDEGGNPSIRTPPS